MSHFQINIAEHQVMQIVFLLSILSSGVIGNHVYCPMKKLEN